MAGKFFPRSQFTNSNEPRNLLVFRYPIVFLTLNDPIAVASRVREPTLISDCDIAARVGDHPSFLQNAGCHAHARSAGPEHLA
jgi:hypothetical protein